MFGTIKWYRLNNTKFIEQILFIKQILMIFFLLKIK